MVKTQAIPDRAQNYDSVLMKRFAFTCAMSPTRKSVFVKSYNFVFEEINTRNWKPVKYLFKRTTSAVCPRRPLSVGGRGS